MSIKHIALRGLRFCGGFALSERLTAAGLRILCYHGIAIQDEDRFRPKLFMRSESFCKRMDWLVANGYRAIRLDDAIDQLNRGEVPQRAVVITFDDGWWGCLDGAFRKLAALSWPATLYSTTYYTQVQQPVFNVAVDYLIWKCGATMLEMNALSSQWSDRIDLGDPKQLRQASDRIRGHGDRDLDAMDRTALLYRLAAALGFDPIELFERRRILTLMSMSELRDAAAMGIDIQLHTHRHRLPADDAVTSTQELVDNRAALAAAAVTELRHLCYPSGQYDQRIFPVLEASGIVSATTTDAGINFPGEQLLSLARFLDGEDVHSIEFQSELAGTHELYRRIRAGQAPWRATSPLNWNRPRMPRARKQDT